MNHERPASVLDGMAGPYDPSAVEVRLYDVWEESGAFQPSDDPSRTPFTIAIPPPNITGQLHNGHVLFVAYQDLMIRWNRMRGRAALWVPGTDHAAIATQNVIERELAKEGASRHAIGRQAFEERFWRWKDEIGESISDQLRRLGASVDWTRECFTLDDQLSRAVREAFVRLYEKGLIYRGQYLVNWCPADQSAISDLEVDHLETDGSLWHVHYPLRGGGRLTVATTRPETMLGDTAIAVHPDDQRYRDLVGARAVVPGIGREIPVIADDAVDPAFGTGAVKITPGHDPNDWAMGQRHSLEIIDIMNGDGTLNDNAGPWAGVERFQARAAYVQFLESEGLLHRVEPHTHAVGHCSRDGAVIEPLVSEQWFVNVRPLADASVQAVREGRVRFHPERFTKEFLRWMDEIQPWCISRQLWLGHRLPVWYCQACGEVLVERQDPSACPRCGAADLQQDPDVLDTWFSSGLWPFSTLGWPDDTPDMQRFYPTDVLETGYDIIFFWVARMVMLGLELADDVPFRDVYLHGLVRHLDGTKVSKSNYQPGDDPLETIAAYGADAMRFTFVTSGAPGNDIRFDVRSVERSARFANKLWNGAKFVIGAMERTRADQPGEPELVDRWILGRLAQVHAQTSRDVDRFRFGEAGRALHDFLWTEFFDWYVEAAKIRLYGGGGAARAARAAHTLQTVLDGSLRLLHPFMPFVTEEIWRYFRAAADAPDAPELLMQADIPDPPSDVDADAIAHVRALIDIVQGIRNARHESNVEPGRFVEARVLGAAPELEAARAFIQKLARAEPLTFHPADAAFDDPAVTVRAGGVEVVLPLAGLVDLAAERERLARELAQAEGALARAEQLLANAGFVQRAPPAVVDKERERAAAARERMAQISERQAALDQ